MKAGNMSLGERGPVGNELDIEPFRRERAMAGAGNVEEIAQRIEDLSRTAPAQARIHPPASLQHNLQWLLR